MVFIIIELTSGMVYIIYMNKFGGSMKSKSKLRQAHGRGGVQVWSRFGARFDSPGEGGVVKYFWGEIQGEIIGGVRGACYRKID